jgi:hypothetical protein
VLDRLDLTGLDRDSCHLLAVQELEAPVLPSMSESLFERSLGNPLFVLETLRTSATHCSSSRRYEHGGTAT